MATPQQLAAFNYSVPGPLAWQSVQTGNFTAVAGNAYLVNTTSGAITVTLPASTTAGQIVQLTDYAGTWATNNVTVSRNGLNINGAAANYTLNVSRGSAAFVYIDATQGWVVYSAFAIPKQSVYSASYLIIAGGAGGGWDAGGGGGAGGRVSGSATFNAESVYTIAVGAGGTAGVIGADGGSGGTSSVTNFTSAVGGGGGASNTYPTARN